MKIYKINNSKYKNQIKEFKLIKMNKITKKIINKQIQIFNNTNSSN